MSSTSDPLIEEHELESSKESAVFHWCILIFTLTLFGLSIFLRSPLDDDHRVFIPGTKTPLPELCTAKRFTGIGCPGCGMTRAFINIADGRFVRAFQFNPASFIVFGLLLAQIPIRIVQIWRIYKGQPTYDLSRHVHVLWFLMIVLITQWVWKISPTFLS